MTEADGCTVGTSQHHGDPKGSFKKGAVSEFGLWVERFDTFLQHLNLIYDENKHYFLKRGNFKR